MAKLVTFQSGDHQGYGVLDHSASTICDFTQVDLSRYGAPDSVRDMLSLIELGHAGAAIANRVRDDVDVWPAAACVDLAGAKLLPSLPRPLTVRDFVSFEKHLLQCARRHEGFEDWTPPQIWYDRPVYYRGNPLSFVGHEAPVPAPKATQKLDYELEMGFIIGKQGRDIPADAGLDYVFGLTIFNDFTARDVQREDAAVYMGPCRSKDYDGCNAMGPWIATLDEIPDVTDLTMTIRLNGKEIGRGKSGDAHHSIGDMIAIASQETTLYPGEFMGTGTVGDGAGLEKGISIKSGDVVELEIDQLGVLRNPVVTHSASNA
ncbi:MAG: fumarylacetoacetate hydrolase family protein [Pseudomonadota bacterium]